MVPRRVSARGCRRGGAGSGPGPVGGFEYRRALARERAVLGCVRAVLLLLTGAACVWAYPGLVADWARGFVAYYLAGLAACVMAVGLALAIRSRAPIGGGRWGRQAGGLAAVLLAVLPVVVAVTVGR